MGNITKLVNDIFSMSFDVIIPISGNIVAIMVAVLLFSIRYFTFRRKQKKFAGRQNHDRMTPRTVPRAVPKAVPLRQTTGEFQPLQAAEYCDDKIRQLLEQAIENRRISLEHQSGKHADLLFCSSMNLELRSKTVRRDAVETTV